MEQFNFKAVVRTLNGRYGWTDEKSMDFVAESIAKLQEIRDDGAMLAAWIYRRAELGRKAREYTKTAGHLATEEQNAIEVVDESVDALTMAELIGQVVKYFGTDHLKNLAAAYVQHCCTVRTRGVATESSIRNALKAANFRPTSSECRIILNTLKKYLAENA